MMAETDLDKVSLHRKERRMCMKRRENKWLAMVLAGVMGVSVLAGCGSTDASKTASVNEKETAEISSASEEATSETAVEDDTEKPELNVMAYSWGMDLNEQPFKKVMEKISGYQIKYYQLPSENADERLMMEIASGSDYDMVYRIGTSVYGQLNEKNALMDISDLLDEYGPAIKENVSDFAWKMVTDEETGAITGIPREGTYFPKEDRTGAVTDGIAFRDDMLEKLDAEIPVTLDDFYQLLKKYKEQTGNAGFTMARGGWNKDIMSAFGMGEAEWYVKDGVISHRVRREGFKDYVAFMQKLYREGLLDNDMPINTSENATEKFVSGNALCTPLWFTAVTELKDSIEMYAPGSKFVYAACLAKDENTPGFLAKSRGISQVSVIPKNSKHPEDAIKWYNAISENYKEIYIGEEGVSYEVKDGKYYPIFPAFNDYLNSDKFSGSAKSEEESQWWQARARKTDEMAEAYAQMNEHANDYEYYVTYESYAAGLPAMQEYRSALQTSVNDLLVKGIAGEEDAETVVNEIISTWEREGGLECEKAMQEWYDENKDLME
jgi:uncharacterized protein in butB 5'region (fragment)